MPNPARGIFAFEFNESKESAGGGFESPLGRTFDTVFIAGAVTSVGIKPLTGKVVARVSDPTGVFVIDGGRKDSSTGRCLSSAVLPSFVTVTGRACGDGGMHIEAEAVAAIDRSMRDSWTGAVSRETAGRMELAVKDGLPGDHMEICRYAGLVERALGTVGAGDSGGDGDGGYDYKCRILEIIDNHPGGKGITLTGLLRTCESLGIKESDAGDAINSLLEEGECYLPAGGYIRRL